MGVVIKQIREGTYYLDRIVRRYVFRIVAVGRRETDEKLHCPTLEFFRKEKDDHPDGLEGLTAVLEYTARNGPPRIRTRFKSVEGSDGLFEFKYFQHRLLCFYDTSHTIICVNGLVKKSDQLPKPAVKIAHDWKHLYESAKEKNLLVYEPEHL